MKVRAAPTMWACALMALGANAAPTSSLEGWYTPDQASAGRTRYAANCAACHGQNLQGGAGPALSGSSFAAKWRNRPLSDLYTVAHEQMPLTAPGSLPVNTSWQIIAYILSFNGFHAGTTALSSLYRFNTGGVLGGGVATYSVKGTQYVTVMSGNTSFHPYKAGGAPTVLVFGLAP